MGWSYRAQASQAVTRIAPLEGEGGDRLHPSTLRRGTVRQHDDETTVRETEIGRAEREDVGREDSDEGGRRRDRRLHVKFR